MLIGVFIKRMRLLSPEELVHVNRMVLPSFFSIMMFYNIYTTDLSSTFKPGLMLFGLLSVIGIFLAALVVVCFFDKDNRRRGASSSHSFAAISCSWAFRLSAICLARRRSRVTTMMVAVIVPALQCVRRDNAGDLSREKVCAFADFHRCIEEPDDPGRTDRCLTAAAWRFGSQGGFEAARPDYGSYVAAGSDHPRCVLQLWQREPL